MSRSYKLPIFKDKPRNYKRTAAYWRPIRRATKVAVQQGREIPEPKTIVNDYDYCDYQTDFRFYRPSYNYNRIKWINWKNLETRK